MSKIQYIDNIPESLELHVDKGDFLELKLCAFNHAADTIINVCVEEGGYFNGVFADFSDDSFKFIINVVLKGFGSECIWHAASLSKNSDKKIFEPSVLHTDRNQKSFMSNYGISRDASTLIFAGNSEIEKGSKESSTRQEAKIIVFDEECHAKASPILKINENDVVASHGASVGRLNEQHLFYLESRGISEERAKRLITLGHLKHIADYFDEEELKHKIIESIENGI